MDNQNDDAIQIHQEFIRREARIHLALQQSGIANPSIRQRVLFTTGELLCRVGSRLKEHSTRRLTAEDASAPTFLIML